MWDVECFKTTAVSDHIWQNDTVIIVTRLRRAKNCRVCSKHICASIMMTNHDPSRFYLIIVIVLNLTLVVTAFTLVAFFVWCQPLIRIATAECSSKRTLYGFESQPPPKSRNQWMKDRIRDWGSEIMHFDGKVTRLKYCHIGWDTRGVGRLWSD